MAQYRLSVYVAKRGDGKAATAMAAYRAAEKIHDQRTGLTIDYSRKQGVLHTEIVTPEGAPEWATDRTELWNRSEAAEKRKDAHVAREIQLSLPCELSDDQRRELATDFARFMAERYNVAVDTAIHAPSKEGDERNHHAHLLICGRPFDEQKAQGLGNKVREFDAISCQRAGQENHVELWRATWAQKMNEALERAEVRTEDGVTVTVDHRSYERQGKAQEPTIKEGTAATAKKRRGEVTERAEQNDDIRQRNEERARLAEEIRAAAQELDLLVRRQAELMAAREAQQAITPAPDPTEGLAPRIAHSTTAQEIAQELTPDNDNEAPQVPVARRAETLTPEQIEAALSDYKRMPWQTEEQHRESAIKAAQRAAEREREEREQEHEGHTRERGFSR